MPRFVLLYHDCPAGHTRPSHWDLMLEAGDVLESWALAALPLAWKQLHVVTEAYFPKCAPLGASNAVCAEQLAGHRLKYLEYEGPVGGGRGQVGRIALGEYARLSSDDASWRIEFLAGLPAGIAELRRPRRCQGHWELVIVE